MSTLSPKLETGSYERVVLGAAGAIPSIQEGVGRLLGKERSPRAETLPLLQGKEHLAPGVYKEFQIEEAQAAIHDIYYSIRGQGTWVGENLEMLDQDEQDTQRFLRTAYNIYEGRTSFEETFRGISLDNVEYAFVVPARGEFSSEAQQVLAITKHLKPDTDENHKMLFQRLLANLPPFVLATYDETGNYR